MSSPVQVMSVRSQPVTPASVTVLVPKSVPETVIVLLFGSVRVGVVVEVEAGAAGRSW